MSKQIEKMYEKFGVSKPIFKVSSNESYGQSRLTLSVIDPYIATDIENTDPVMQMVIDNYEEQFDVRTKAFKKRMKANSIFLDIMRYLQRFYISASPLKNPKASKTYKWLESVSDKYNHDFADGFISLYRYTCLHVNADNGFNSKTDPHATNFIAILEKVREKYET